MWCPKLLFVQKFQESVDTQAAGYIVVEFLSCIYIYILSTSPRVHEYTESTELSRFELNRNKVKNNLYVRICK